MSLAKTPRRKERQVNRSVFRPLLRRGHKARFYTFSGGKLGGWEVRRFGSTKYQV
ncbi:hypothetical protein [Aquiflexum gelatinilyticum]|uniref:Uncharacterized protein n=1 Tax=Aquiflexum gelatinilyticum TaxID=2961943 RepID=A0A9X2P3W7_9BACT|nr:hypothetical protein [Aquiflexum gelatinilyticum]MCR9013618.1 hypothetical protein [Aquiflexum gelatinilyticum]